MTELSDAEKQAYLNASAYCPWCKSTKIIAEGQLEIELIQASQRIRCYGCKRVWLDIYTLTDIEEIEDG